MYGVIVTLIGFFDSRAEIDKAQGVRINLWAGLAMLAFGLLMLLWQWLRPAEAPTPNEQSPALTVRSRAWPSPARGTPGGSGNVSGTGGNAMTDRDPRPPLEESPQVAAAVDDDSTVPQLRTGGGSDRGQPGLRRAPGTVRRTSRRTATS